MRLWKKYKGSFLAFILVISMISSVTFVSGAFAQDEQETTTEETSETSKAITEETSETSKATTETKDKSFGVQVQSNSDEQLFNVNCKFDGKALSDVEDKNENIATNWNVSASKILEVEIKRNSSIKIDSNKQYYACLKVPDIFYFNGLPDANKITGVEDVCIIKNTTPQVYTNSGNLTSLDKFSSYSGEIRLRLNPNVDTITLKDIGISCDKRLIGFTGGTQTIENPISISIVKVDTSEDIESFTEEEKEEISKFNIDKEQITSGSLAGGGMKNTMSTTGYASYTDQQNVTVSKDGTIAYAGGTAGEENQIYKSLTVEFQCPYVSDSNGKKHYLEFDLNDTALSDNKQGNAKGYKMKNAVYNDQDHTITYTFENIYLGGHTILFYTPKFSWPKDMESQTISQKTKIEGTTWKITNQICYTGANATLRNEYTSPYAAYYIPEGVDVKMTSSAMASSDQQIAKRYLYQGLTRENKNEATLGFFDVHNEGTQDSGELKITFEFNTDQTSTGKYYVTKVNLPISKNETGTNIEYILSNDSDQEVTGTKYYSDKKSSFTCNVSDLKKDANVTGEYYIKKLTYTTKLIAGRNYHAETAHLYRNREADSGLFFGYIEGALNATASAKMTIESEDGKNITTNNEDKIDSTETSTISDQDYIGYGLSSMTVNGENSQLITAGSSAKLKFGANISTEEYPNNGSKQVNGYHTFRDGIIYICLPEGVSIGGTDQVEVVQGTRKIESKSVSTIENSQCIVNGTSAKWWQIEVDDINAVKNSFTVEIQLSTDNRMQGIIWDFQNCVGIRVKGQEVSWAAASDRTKLYQTINKLKNDVDGKLSILANSLQTNESEQDLKKFGVCFYNPSTVKLNIARAEAKLDVATSLQTKGSSTVQNLKVKSKDTEIAYNVIISSNDGGYAKDFSYYIPIPSDKSEIDADSWVAKNEFNLKLQDKIEIQSTDTGNSIEQDQSPYQVAYTTDENLDSNLVKASDVTWKTESEMGEDYSKVTAIRIITKESQYINANESYHFVTKLKYDGTNFDQMAGSKVQWRSFGHYTYNRNNATTTNTYPSPDNMITLGYEKDLTDSATNITLGTSDQIEDPISGVIDVIDQDHGFKKSQDIKIKKVEVSSGTKLISNDPTKLTGTQANNQFKITCAVNNGTRTTLLSETSDSTEWSVAANSDIKLVFDVAYSKAMTDNTTQRYVKITIGNDDIDMTYQINLLRDIEVVSASDSGIVAGELYQVPKVGSTCSISNKSSFTGLYVIKNYVPGNFKNQMITWKKNDTAEKFPKGTTICMMPISDQNEVTGYWYYRSDGTKSSVDLSQLKKMSGKETYTYNTTATTGTTLKYLFVVNFGNASVDEGEYQLVFGVNGVSSDNILNDIKLPVTIEAETIYDLEVKDVAESQMKKMISYKITQSKGDDNYQQGKTLAVVLTPTQISDIPKDAYIQVGDQEYKKNGENKFIIPIGTIQDGEKEMTLKSDMFPDEGKTYQFEAQLYLVNSTISEAALNGNKVGNEKQVSFTKKESLNPSMKVTGTQIATVSEWNHGQDITINTKNITENGKILTVTAYRGLTGVQKVTDLLSSVSGIFTLENGSGTYDESKNATGKLILNSSAQKGTYRLVFEVKDKDGKTELTVPYYIIIE